MNVKKNALRCAEKVERAYFNALPALTVAGMMVMQNMAFAADQGNIQSLVKMIIQAVSMLLGVFGVIRLVTAIAELGAASADDGPAKLKAKNDLATAVMIFAIGVILGLSAGAISGLVTVSGLTT